MTKHDYTFEQAWDDGDIIIILLTIISLIITEIGSCLAPSNQQQQHVSGSLFTTHLKSVLAENQPPFVSTNATLHTEDQKKEVGITKPAGRSRRSASSPRSKPSKPRSTSKPTPNRKSVKKPITSVGQRGGFGTTINTPSSIQKPGRITNKES